MAKKIQKKKVRITSKQKKLAKLISVNIGREHPLTMEEMMLKAGYSKSQARRQTGVVDSDGLQQELKPVVDELTEHRKSIIKRMKRTLGKAKYRDAVDGLDKVTKNIELLSGRATDRVYILSDEDKAKIMALKNRK